MAQPLRPIDIGNVDDLRESESGPNREEPKRGRGRPKGSTSGVGGAAARVRGFSAAAKASVEQNVRALVGGLNLAASFAPQYIPTEDLLTDTEADALVKAITAEALASERIMTWMERAAVVTPHILLIKTCYEIILPRVMRRRGIMRAPTTRAELDDMKMKVGEPGATQLEELFGAAVDATG